jgi:hypothetical protein
LTAVYGHIFICPGWGLVMEVMRGSLRREER